MKNPRLASNIMGSKIMTRQGENIGTVQNLVLYPESGTIIYIVLCYANFIGKTNRYYAIPNRVLKSDDQNKRSLIFDTNSEVLLQAPCLSENENWPLNIWSQNDTHIYELVSN